MPKTLLLLLPALYLFGLGAAPVRAQEPAADTAPVLTLSAAIREALDFSPQLRASQERIVQAQAQLREAYGMLLLPSLSAAGSYTRADEEISLDFGGMNDLYRLVQPNCDGWDADAYGPRPSLCDMPVAPPTEEEASESSARVIQELNNWDASVSVAMPLLNARAFPNLKNFSTGRELAQLAKEFATEQLVYAVTQLYYGVSTSQTAVKLMRQNLANAMRHLDYTEVRVRAGVALQNERVRAAITVLQNRNRLEQAQLSLDLARQSLALLIGREDHAFVVEESPANPWADLSADAARETLRGRRLDVRMLEKNVLMAERSVNDIWMQFVPTLNGVWTYSYSSNEGFAGRNTQWRAMINLNWNILQGGARFQRLDAARSRVRELQFNMDNTLLEARREVDEAEANIRMAQADLTTAEEMAALAEENLKLVEKQYKAGISQQTAILDAELQFESARIQTLQSRLRLALARVALARVSGRIREVDFTE